MLRRSSHLHWIQPPQHLETVPPLPITTLPCTLEPLYQDPIHHILLRESPQLSDSLGNDPSTKTLPKIPLQSLHIRQKPRLHHLHHQMTLFIRSPLQVDLQPRPSPANALHNRIRPHRPLRINYQESRNSLARMACLESVCKPPPFLHTVTIRGIFPTNPALL